MEVQIMAKVKNSNANNGRWLIIDTQSPSSDMIVASLEKIEGAEIKVISHKTYVRFNKSNKNASHYAVISKLSRVFKKASQRPVVDESDEKIKHYCAIVLK